MIACWIKGHRWTRLTRHMVWCERCGKQKVWDGVWQRKGM